MNAISWCPSPDRCSTHSRPAPSKSRSTQSSPPGSSGTPISTASIPAWWMVGSRSSCNAMSVSMTASARALDVTRRIPSDPSSLVSSSTSYPKPRAAVVTPIAISIMTGTYRSPRSGTIRASTLDRLLASARAPACGWYPSSAIDARTRRRVSSETDRLPLSTYDTVLAATPACLATSASVAIVPLNTRRASLRYLPSRHLYRRVGGLPAAPTASAHRTRSGPAGR